MAGLISVIDCISQASMEIGISQRPISTAVGSSDQDISQMQALLSTVADEVLLEQPYRVTLGDGIWVFSSDMEPKEKITSDSDLIGFDARLAIDGLKYRFLKAKGLEFGEEMRDFLTRLNKLGARANAVVLDLDADEGRVQ
ncbi:hypothetical protein [Mesorhizobium sp.]|uniref:hypothetical protein n=1 Tax=Mesorhizobium sp. TaxID=1871066 RepID=UPI000FE6ECBC|nr:hypothetical protein [Mesorhizobium sp.]RWP05098.1 MAG: hypothetical protein EOQ99_16645 [Mesorhizobium sp.]